MTERADAGKVDRGGDARRGARQVPPPEASDRKRDVACPVSDTFAMYRRRAVDAGRVGHDHSRGGHHESLERTLDQRHYVAVARERFRNRGVVRPRDAETNGEGKKGMFSRSRGRILRRVSLEQGPGVNRDGVDSVVPRGHEGRPEGRLPQIRSRRCSAGCGVPELNRDRTGSREFLPRPGGIGEICDGGAYADRTPAEKAAEPLSPVRTARPSEPQGPARTAGWRAS
jgi:hypothetical protein